MRVQRAVWYVAVVACLAWMASPARAGTVLADSMSGFSSTQGLNGWSYGYYTSPTSSPTFHLFSQYADGYWTNKTGTGGTWTFVNEYAEHPNSIIPGGGRLGVEQWATRRWTSTVSGTVDIAGLVGKCTTGTNVKGVNPAPDGTMAYINVNGKTIWSHRLQDNDTASFNYDVQTTLQKGSTVDFVLSPVANANYDTTRYTSTITQVLPSSPAVPEPSGLGVLALAVLPMCRRRA